jgi:hypothetical protein
MALNPRLAQGQRINHEQAFSDGEACTNQAESFFSTRWPFSYPVDSSVYKENDILKKSLSAAQMGASKWQFVYELRNAARDVHGERLECPFALGLSPDAPSRVWTELQQLLNLARWHQMPNGAAGINGNGITVLVPEGNTDGMACATALSRALMNNFSTAIAIRPNQNNSTLMACENKCIELDIGK